MGVLQRLFGGGQGSRPGARPVVAAACPYCGVILDPPPQRNRKCPACKENIIVRTRRADGAKLFLTAADGRAFDEQRKKEAARNSALRHARNIGIVDHAFQQKEQALAKKWDSDPRDVFWALANEAVISAMKAGDWHRLSMIYWEQALFMCEQGQPHLDLQREASKSQLREIAATYADLATGGHSFNKVEILGNACCDVCRKNHGRRFSIRDALEMLPIPNEACEEDWCNCIWISVVE